MRTKLYTWVVIETGELLTTKEMLQMAADEYDLDDITNAIEIYEYFEELPKPIAA